MHISKIEQNSSPIIPQTSLSWMEMYDRIKEEIKQEIEICVPAKVLSISGYYATVQPLPNIKTNAEKFIERKPVKVKFIGNVSIGDVGYLISGDISQTDKKGTPIHDRTYDPAESELHKFSNGFFIAQTETESGIRKVRRSRYFEHPNNNIDFNLEIILEDRYDSNTNPQHGTGVDGDGYPEELYSLDTHIAIGSLSQSINETTQKYLSIDQDTIRRIALRESGYPLSLYVSALFGYNDGTGFYRRWPFTRIDKQTIVLSPISRNAINTYRTKYRYIVNNVTVYIPPFCALLPMYEIDLYDYFKNNGKPRITADYSDLIPASLPYFGKKYYNKISHQP
jgi:hypothetical protein